MTDFILKSTLSMAILLTLYHLLLEKEKMPRFNRFYLLGALILSYAVPFISIPVYVEAVAAPVYTFDPLPTGPVFPAQESATNYLPYLVGAIYAVVTVALVIRFRINLIRFRIKVKSNTIIEYKSAKLVLLDEKILPYTFLNYIFISKQEYEKGQIEKELYTHELAHVNQKHTLDILFIEALKMFFWFNPMLYFYKKAIQLNHEFLADQAVLETTQDTTYYQELLLQTASFGYSPFLASSLNFSLTKKRFIMMTKAVNKQKAIVLQLLSFPVITALVAFMCIKTVAQVQPEPAKNSVGTDKAKKLEDIQRRDKPKDEKVILPVIPAPDNKQDHKNIVQETQQVMQQNEYQEQDKFPQFTEGSFHEYIQKNLKLSDIKEDMKVRVYLSFIVETDGSLSDIKVVRDPGHGLGDEIKKVAEKSPKWTPGIKNGKPHRMEYTVPIVIMIKN